MGKMGERGEGGGWLLWGGRFVKRRKRELRCFDCNGGMLCYGSLMRRII